MTCQALSLVVAVTVSRVPWQAAGPGLPAAAALPPGSGPSRSGGAGRGADARLPGPRRTRAAAVGRAPRCAGRGLWAQRGGKARAGTPSHPVRVRLSRARPSERVAGVRPGLRSGLRGANGCGGGSRGGSGGGPSPRAGKRTGSTSDPSLPGDSDPRLGRIRVSSGDSDSDLADGSSAGGGPSPRDWVQAHWQHL
jgi:hypothetical protein